MDQIEESVDVSVIEENFFTSSQGERAMSSVNMSPCISQIQNKKCRPPISNSTLDPEGIVVTEAKIIFKQEKSIMQENAENSDRSVPCSQANTSSCLGSDIVALVPETQTSTPQEQAQELSPLPENTGESTVTCKEEEVHLYSDKELITNSNKVEDTSYDFSTCKDQGYLVLDKESPDVNYSLIASAFNQQYQGEGEMVDSLTVSESFSPEAFSTIPQLKNPRNQNSADVAPETSMSKSVISSSYEKSVESSSYPSCGHELISTQSEYTVDIQGNNLSEPNTPSLQDPNTKMSCYVVIVPIPLYFENMVVQESCLQIEEAQVKDKSAPVLSDSLPGKVTEIETTPDVTVQTPVTTPMLPPSWTPAPKTANRTPLTSTRVRVSPSPHRGNKSSPIISVCTTSTPIQPLQGNKQKYVIVQGNSRHLRGIPSYHNSFTTPTVEEGHQPIYLQGLPPQGFRRLWKGKDSTASERATKRSLDLFFSKTVAPVNQEATVPQMEKSPLTSVRNKKPCDREVPETNHETNLEQGLSNEDTPDQSQTSEEAKKSDGKGKSGIEELDSTHSEEVAVLKEIINGEEVTITPVTHGKCREDKERKKIRDRKYDADLKEAFEDLRSLVPRVQRSCSRGQILQETIKYIGLLENKILEAGICSTFGTTLGTPVHNEPPMKKAQGYGVEGKSSSCSFPVMFPGVCDAIPTLLPEDESSQVLLDSQETSLSSPIIVSTQSGDGRFSLVNHEGAVLLDHGDTFDDRTVFLEEMPLSIPFPQIQLASAEEINASQVLGSQTNDESSSPGTYTRFFPVLGIPIDTQSGEELKSSQGEEFSPNRDVLLSAMTTLSPEGLSDLGVTMSPLGILLSPGGNPAQSSAASVVEYTSTGAEENTIASCGVVPGQYSDMTSIAASVEVTTNHRERSSSTKVGRNRRGGGPTTAQIVPSASPLKVGNASPRSPHARNTNVLQDHSNFHDARSILCDRTRGKRQKLKRDRSSQQPGSDENSPLSADQSRTPPGRVSSVIVKERKKTARSRGRGETKTIRRT